MNLELVGQVKKFVAKYIYELHLTLKTNNKYSKKLYYYVIHIN